MLYAPQRSPTKLFFLSLPEQTCHGREEICSSLPHLPLPLYHQPCFQKGPWAPKDGPQPPKSEPLPTLVLQSNKAYTQVNLTHLLMCIIVIGLHCN